MADDIVVRLKATLKKATGTSARWLMHDLHEGIHEIERLRAEVERKSDYAERMDALAEERLIECNRLRAEIAQLESAWTFISIWKGRYESERALADQLAEALRWVSDPELCEESHETIIGIWQSTAAALAAYETARKEEQ